MKKVCISGYFTLIHVGHIRLMKEAKALGDYLVVILNNDDQLKVKKGKVVVSAAHRKEIIEAIKCVDEVVVSIDKDGSQCETLAMIKPDIFANGGDRNEGNIPEVQTCIDNNIEMVYNVGAGGKIDSSTRLLKEQENQ